MLFRGKDVPIKDSDYVNVSMPPRGKVLGERTKKEALAYFDWFMENLEARIHNMCVYLQFEGDYTPESLIELWRLVMRSYGTIPEDEFNTIRSCAGLYLAETLRHTYPVLSWGCQLKGPKDLIDKNMPVLQGFVTESGFRPNFEPENLICVQAVRITENWADEEQLIRLFEKFSQYVPGHVAKPPREDPHPPPKPKIMIVDDTGKKAPIVFTEFSDEVYKTIEKIVRGKKDKKS